MLPSPNKKILFVSLRCFNLTGGIENVCKNICYHYNQEHLDAQIAFSMISLYDHLPDEHYIESKLFKGFEGRRISGFFSSIKSGIQQDLVILSHINLSPIGLMIKLLNPKTKVVLWAHGIEIWRPINIVKKTFLKKVDQIIAVSRFTATSVTSWHHVNPEKVLVIPNSLDPLYQFPEIIDTKEKVYGQYHLKKEFPIFMAVCRIKSSEKNKNYDQVIQCLAQMKKGGLPAYYFLCGKYEEAELNRLKKLAVSLDFVENLMMPGFLSNDEIINIQQAADAFVLPSDKEGFGLVFIEAQAAGLNVLSGDKDGSVDAVIPTKYNKTIDPQNIKELTSALTEFYKNPSSYSEKVLLQKECKNLFGYQNFQKNLKTYIN
ncbi:glycosyltransferase family 4 protein [Pedobacter sp. SD-b]|uniref:Glycosyltransferase family 4 protein n=1 Tax=Pedobacter segetis TaxID=2793069 RepID=A0ABS1BGT4_9SPHI|nr:glycosyltransferase family 4 protein [Pedobacter segetis]MBK0382085.1 glycosyltransferase family 4 protein [Pedobacter segetis]